MVRSQFPIRTRSGDSRERGTVTSQQSQQSATYHQQWLFKAFKMPRCWRGWCQGLDVSRITHWQPSSRDKKSRMIRRRMVQEPGLLLVLASLELALPSQLLFL